MAPKTQRQHLVKLLARRTPLHHKQLPIVITWAHKAGCTFLVKWFFWQLNLLEEATVYGATKPNIAVHAYENQVFKRRRGYVHALASRIENGTPVINFLRCPYERAFSSFMHINNPVLTSVLAQRRQTATLRFRTRVVQDVHGVQAAADTPLRFDEYLNWLQAQEMSSVNVHHQPQTTPLYELPGLRHFRLEDAHIVLSWVEWLLGLRPSVTAGAALRSSLHHTSKCTQDLSTTLAFLERPVTLDRPATRPVPRITRTALEDTSYARQIESLYSEDIALYDSLHRIEAPPARRTRGT